MALLLLALTAHSTVLAQDNAPPTLIITGMDFSDLPDVHVTVSGTNLGASLAKLPVTLKEDRVEQPITASKPVDVGIATAFLIDASDNIRDQGNTGEARTVEIANAVEGFIRMRLLAAETDWMAAYTVAPDGKNFQTLADWSQDHQAVANELRRYNPQELAETTPLFNLLKYGLDQVELAPFPSNLRRSIVVFSDGFDSLSAVEIDDIINRANRLGVTIHTVMVGPEEESRRQNLQRISELSNGRYVLYSSQADLEPLWRQLAAERQQQQYTYRLTKREPDLLEIAVATPSGRVLSDEMEFGYVPLLPAQIQIVEPSADATITRTGTAPDTPQADLEPAALNILLDIQWPDNHPRSFDRIEFEIGGRTLTQSEEPFTTFAFPLAQLGAGPQTLRVLAYDELEIESRSAPQTFDVALVWPTALPTPEPTVEATAVPIAVGDASATEVVTGTVGGDAAQTGTETGKATGTATAVPNPTKVITITQLPSDEWVPGVAWTLGNFNVAYGATRAGERQLRLGSYIVPITWVTITLAATPILLLIGGLALVGRRRKTPAAALAPAAYDPTSVADNKSTMIDATAYELTEDATEAQPIVDFESPASLIYQEGGEHLPPKLPIEGGREIRIGRKAAYCDVIIDDQRVSRLHASIHEREDGNFYLKDEGSSGGTFVNRRKLRVNDEHLLHHNDIINFNTVAYRFELADGAAGSNTGSNTGSESAAKQTK